jgi:hypothetical protein
LRNRVAHAIISEYVRAYPAMPHTEVLARFSNQLDGAIVQVQSHVFPPDGLAESV